MSNEKTAAVQDVQYRRAKTWELICANACNGCNICFYMCMVYASYAGSEGYGIATALVGIIITATRILDAVTDTAIAYIFEKFPTKYGKCRPFLLVGWAIEASAVFFMYSVAAGHFKGGMGIFMFILIYIWYVIGYTVNNVAGQVMGAVITNDPKQRPMMGFWGTLFSYGTPVLLNNIVAFSMLPRHNNQYDMPMLKEMTTFYIFVGLVCSLISCVGIWRSDNEKNWLEASAKLADDKSKQEKVGLKEMWEVLSKNKDVQRYIVIYHFIWS